MSPTKDFNFRLFGRNVTMNLKVDQVGENYNDNDCDYGCISSSDNLKQGENRAQHEKTSNEEPNNTKEEENPPKTSKGSQSTITDDTKTAFNSKECSSQDSYDKHVSDETGSTKSCTPQVRKPLKKPKKIIPCPRCNSMATKFCYFNNYNVKQPRHFCKDCQRYWTAGGTMRSVPVGAGRRKSKNSPASHNQSFGLLQENVNTNLMFLDQGENKVNFHGLPLQSRYMLNTVALPSGFPVSFYATAQSDQCCTISDGPNSILSRKHSRDGTMLFFDNETKIESGRIVRGKTSKVDDPIEAINSSIWSTLQLKNNHVSDSLIAKGGFFRGARQYNGNGVHERSNDPSAKDLSMVLKSNPAAFSRSLSFQETR